MTRIHFRSRQLLSLVGLAALLALPEACGPFHRGQVTQGQIVFVNQSIDQADVYAAGPDGNPVRIGTVLAGRTETLTVPSSVVSQAGNMTVSVHILAGRTITSGSFSLGSGDTMQVRLPPDERSLVVLPGGADQ
jgi:hypothetical protein